MPPQYFFTVDKDYHLAVIHSEGAAGMVNVLRAEQGSLQRAYRAYPTVPLVLDSAAPQGNTNIRGYAESIKRLAWRFQWFSSLDVLGSQDQSERNYERLCRLLPDELDHRVVWIYQTNREQPYRARQKQLARLGDVLKQQRHERIGVGGLVPFLMRRGGVGRALRVLEEIRQVFVDTQTQTRAHLFGVGTPVLLQWAARQHWIESLDSGKWLIGLKAGEVLRLFGDQQKAEEDLGLPLTPREVVAINIRVLRRWMHPDAVQQLALPPACRTDEVSFPLASTGLPLFDDELATATQLPLWPSPLEIVHARASERSVQR